MKNGNERNVFTRRSSVSQAVYAWAYRLTEQSWHYIRDANQREHTDMSRYHTCCVIGWWKVAQARQKVFNTVTWQLRLVHRTTFLVIERLQKWIRKPRMTNPDDLGILGFRKSQNTISKKIKCQQTATAEWIFLSYYLVLHVRTHKMCAWWSEFALWLEINSFEEVCMCVQ